MNQQDEPSEDPIRTIDVLLISVLIFAGACALLVAKTIGKVRRWLP